MENFVHLVTCFCACLKPHHFARSGELLAFLRADFALCLEVRLVANESEARVELRDIEHALEPLADASEAMLVSNIVQQNNIVALP